jgi:SAM-dependent methyltransferase
VTGENSIVENQHDNLLEYSDPAIYDLENRSFEPDGPFYLALAQRIGGPVLELGCGTGRITIPLAQDGVDVTGLDVVPGMLARALNKAQGLPIRWVEADARSFRLDREFRLILETGSTFQHLLERADQEAVLSRVREHLAQGGYFVVSTVFPRLDLMQDLEEEDDWFTYEDEQGQEVRVSGTQHYNPLRQVKVETAYRRWYDAQGREMVREVPLALRLIFPQEMEVLLHYNGFEVVERYGDWDGSPLTAESRMMIYVCQKAN